MYYSLRKSRRILRMGHRLLTQKGHKLLQTPHQQLESDLRTLDKLVLAKQKEEASPVAHRVEEQIKKYFPKTFFDHTKEIIFALLFAIVVAFLVRQFWFELYEVPTGSMRPTIEELDRLVVSKTPFGIHLPFKKKALFYSDDLILRAGTVVFTVEGMDIPDSDMRYFYVFPGKKRYIKRAIGKPGDTLYFYGGRIYGIDQKGDPFTTFTDKNFLEKNHIDKIDHIPYITFEGRTD